ncbi:hypothetical protein PYCC9005_001579 [Savitreella phatthalungensis]
MSSTSPDFKPRSILKNRDEHTPADPYGSTEAHTLQNAHPLLNDAASAPTSSTTPTTDADPLRLKWDEANLYLTEQERSSTMKITEPKTPYAPKYDPSTDVDSGEGDEGVGDGGEEMMDLDGVGEIPALELGSAEGEVGGGGGGVMSMGSGSKLRRKVSLADDDTEAAAARATARNADDSSTHNHNNVHHEDDGGSDPETEAEKHRRFEELRKQHYGGAAMALRRGSLPIESSDEDEG